MTGQKKRLEPVGAGQAFKSNSNKQLHNSKPLRKCALSPRMLRLLHALMRGPQSARELADAIPANNPPAYIQILRERQSLEIPLERVQFTTIDGKPSWYGSYHLTERDREKVSELIRG